MIPFKKISTKRGQTPQQSKFIICFDIIHTLYHECNANALLQLCNDKDCFLIALSSSGSTTIICNDLGSQLNLLPPMWVLILTSKKKKKQHYVVH